MCEDYCNNLNKIHKITFRVLSLIVSTPGLKRTPFTTIYRSDFFIHTYNTYVKASDENVTRLVMGLFLGFPIYQPYSTFAKWENQEKPIQVKEEP